MSIEVKVLNKSKHPWGGPDLITFELRYPRCIHAEFMTHRVFSRNASSSRAIPVERLIADVENDPFIPSHWGKNQKGMQADAELSADEIIQATTGWLEALEHTKRTASRLATTGLHKQIVNRLLEPFAHIRVVVSATEWDNFYALRCHSAAEPHIRDLAIAMQSAALEAPYTALIGGWHLPYLDGTEARLDVSAARCARVSYKTHDGVASSYEADAELARRLLDGPHMSPFEHQAMPVKGNKSKHLWGNYHGWIQYRKVLEEAISNNSAANDL
jgi:thymidylate synthase ThyX